MSVVNKMLKDLENREASQAPPANYQPPEKKSSATMRISLILIVGALLIGVMYWWPVPTADQPASPAVAPINQAVVEPQQAPAVPEEPAAEVISATMMPAVNEPALSESTGPGEALPASGEQAPAPAITNRLPAGEESASAAQKPAAVIVAPEPATPVIKPSSADPEDALKAQIRQAISQNDTPRAIQLLRTLIRQQPDNVAARKRLAALYFSAGRTLDAQQLLQQSVADMPGDSSVRLMYARLLVQQNETKLAYYALQDINEHAQPSIELLGYRAALAQKLSLMDEALKDYAQLVVLDNENAKWWLGQAVVADKQGYVTLATNSYREALSLQQLDANIEQFIRQRLNNLTGVSS
ncbi:tetratricopeptide repeat protein [Alteromonas lipolytica]|uniref:Uncharacterized protein n=1 Tax=Alteromonas lipolytica TaxID=1856405 RepID=A0A1E8F8I0_9ALTE|nr:DUF6584 family protein [Alteromonas lipolytica]OFI32227.1 hypothetical protein BFC17_08390 [Alteromonas lipolytica]GGF82867.1 MSHA biogenesis protein MshN [Alteromonas lipolytica]